MDSRQGETRADKLEACVLACPNSASGASEASRKCPSRHHRSPALLQIGTYTALLKNQSRHALTSTTSEGNEIQGHLILHRAEGDWFDWLLRWPHTFLSLHKRKFDLKKKIYCVYWNFNPEMSSPFFKLSSFAKIHYKIQLRGIF